MGKLHEILAVEKDAKNVAKKVIEETSSIFGGRSERFTGMRKKYVPLNEDDMDLPDEEHTPMVTTVKDKLDYTQKSVSKLLDIIYQKEKGNVNAKEDIVTEDGIVIAKDVPVTVLVQFENLLNDLRNRVYNNIPTLDPSKTWTEDKTEANVHMAEEEKRVRSKKCPESVILAPATDKHKAQAQLIMVDKKVGDYVTTYKSGAFSPKQKSDVLGRIDQVIEAVKIARSKANDTVTPSDKIGKEIFEFINKF